MKAIRLKTEFLSNPIGVDFQKPLLTWNCEGGVTQSAYRVIVKSNGVIAWDTGKVEGNVMRVIYPRKLQSRKRIDWSVTLWDENGIQGEEAHAFFEMGLLEKSDWRAKWISGNYTVNPIKKYPVDYFKKEFDTQNIKKARISDLKVKCAKRGLDFDTENQKYLEKVAKKAKK